MASNEPAAKVEDIQNDLVQLRNDVSQLAQQMASLFAAGSEEALDDVKGRVRRMKNGFEGAMADAGERGREAFDEVSENIGEAIETSLRDHPLTTVALAVGFGFLFGTAWRR